MHSESRTYRVPSLYSPDSGRAASISHCATYTVHNSLLRGGDFNNIIKSSFQELCNFLSQAMNNPFDFKAENTMHCLYLKVLFLEKSGWEHTHTHTQRNKTKYLEA